MSQNHLVDLTAEENKYLRVVNLRNLDLRAFEVSVPEVSNLPSILRDDDRVFSSS
jgi:hypothetical protein